MTFCEGIDCLNLDENVNLLLLFIIHTVRLLPTYEKESKPSNNCVCGWNSSPLNSNYFISNVLLEVNVIFELVYDFNENQEAI